MYKNIYPLRPLFITYFSPVYNVYFLHVQYLIEHVMKNVKYNNGF